MARVTAIFVMLLVATGCGVNGASSDPGLDAVVRVNGAQFVAGARPDATDGPQVLSVETRNLAVYPGQPSRSLTGLIASTAASISVGLEGDAGYWVVPAGPPDAFTSQLTFDVKLSFARTLHPGPVPVSVRAVDARGRFGAPTVLTYQASSLAAAGAMVVSLSWDADADLDLRVVEPDGIEIWAKNINAHVPPSLGQDQPPDSIVLGYGILDLDSNSSCIIDGRRQENVIWRDPPASGRYLVRVDTFSLCGQPMARWTVEASRDGVVVGRATGVGTDVDTRFSHQAGAGQLALEIDVP